MNRTIVWVILINLLLIYSCTQEKEGEFHLDENAVREQCAIHAELQPWCDSLVLFYSGRNYAFAWLDGKGLNSHAEAFKNRMIRDEQSFGTASGGVYRRLGELDKLTSEKRYPFSGTDSLTKEFEVLLTAAFFKYVQQNWEGISDNKTKEMGWFITRKKVNAIGLLDALLETDSKVMAEYEAVNKQYELLKNYLVRYRQMENQSGLGTLDPGESLKIGDRDAHIIQIKQQLFLFKDLAKNDSSDLFDQTFEAAVKKFQHRHGLETDGVISRKTTDALNTSIHQRIDQILINMERYKWLPLSYKGDHILINIPEFRMYVYHNDTLQWNCEVVVGSESNSTVIFNDSLETIVFSPSWNTPESIVLNEILPAIKKNPEYLAKHNMEVTDASGSPVDASALRVNYEKGFPYSIRQRPGDGNALGRVKFLFPNSHSIYLHDTPSKSLFEETSRAFSHGCIRVSEPFKLAQYLLRSEKQWTDDSIKALMYGGKETFVKLRPKVPVFIAYFTAWVDENGDINFREDVYEHDEKLKDVLASRTL